MRAAILARTATRRLIRLSGLAALAAGLGGCALNFIDRAAPTAQSGGGRVVVEGRINYIVDGVNKAPYGSFKPSWPAPRLTAIQLETGAPFASPLVADGDGSFRWLLAPGAYVVARIGFGTYTDDTYLAWPGVVICVPALASGTLYVGHLRLNGTRNEEEFEPASGKMYRYSGVRYRPDVEDERAAPTAAAAKSLMQVRKDFPLGDKLQQRFLSDRAALIQEACPRQG